MLLLRERVAADGCPYVCGVAVQNVRPVIQPMSFGKSGGASRSRNLEELL